MFDFIAREAVSRHCAMLFSNQPKLLVSYGAMERTRKHLSLLEAMQGVRSLVDHNLIMETLSLAF
jgi:hypothetical protein